MLISNLRFGDFVIINGTVTEITPTVLLKLLSEYIDDVNADIENIQPIELTASVLRILGLSRLRGGTFICEKKDEYFIRYSDLKQFDETEKILMADNYKKLGNVQLTNVKYLHQMQHVLSEIGIDTFITAEKVDGLLKNVKILSDF